MDWCDPAHCYSLNLILIATQADYIPLNASDMEWDCLDADDDADTGLF
jgi:hypothetical protein